MTDRYDDPFAGLGDDPIDTGLGHKRLSLDWSQAEAEDAKPDTRAKYPCERCGGTGTYTYGYVNRRTGTCRGCNGRGYFVKSSSERFAERTKRHARKAAVKADAQQAFNEGYPGLMAFLRDSARWSSFAQEMVNAFEQYGSLTERQAAAAMRMFEKATATKLQRAAEAKAAERPVDLSAIQAMFDKAASRGLKRPAYRAEGLVISQASARGRNPGALYVKALDNDVYLGMVAGGVFKPRRECGDAHKAALATIAQNPLDAAVKYGRLTGRCAICSRLLTAEESVERGIGPICAENMGL